MKRRFILLSGSLLALSFILFLVSRSRSFQLMGELINRVPTERRAIALTIDDGPTRRTPYLLEVLRQANIKATFFVLGASLEKEPELAKAIVSEGHELGNHTYSHPLMLLRSFSFIDNQITRTDALIRKAGHQGPIHFRAPGSKKLFMLPYYLKKSGRKHILFDLEPDSYPSVAKDPDAIVKYALENARPGSILLLHGMYEGNDASVKAIPGIVSGLRNQGYEFLTVNQLLSSSTN
ncbi:MAG: polysaccharide deacetylase family protein [Bdellovibrionota bacterium]